MTWPAPTGVPDVRFARFKRVLECYQADPAYRRLIADDAEAAVRLHGIAGSDGRLVREAVEAILFGRAEACGDESERSEQPYVSAYQAHVRPVIEAASAMVRGERYANGAARAYVARSLSRARLESAVVRAHAQIRYVPLAFELSEGCRMHCPFCGLAAPAWRRDAPYERDAWRSLVAVGRERLGPICDQAPLYFATEPLDHPAYEDFLRDVAETSEHIPQTTTAAPERDPDRTRRLMRWLGSKRLLLEGRLRFSIRTLAQFKRVIEAFSAEELAGVELLVNNPESINPVADAGRARAAGVFEARRHVRYSISCLAGVLVRLWDQSMSFVEPLAPSERHPLGIRVHETLPCSTAEDLADGIERLFVRHGGSTPDANRRLRLSHEIGVAAHGDRLMLLGDGTGFGISRNLYTETLLGLLSCDSSGLTLHEIEGQVALDGCHAQEMRALVCTLYQKGYIEYV